MKKYTILLSTCFTVLAGSAIAENYAVVRDNHNNIVKNTFQNCVRTKWQSASDACGSQQTVATPSRIVEVAPSIKKPIKRSRSYLVFFDYNKSDLTPSAIDIIKKANQEAHLANKGEINFSITGHADRSGSDDYNMKLSNRRSNSVKGELVKLGNESNIIETSAKGEAEPLVPTKDGVKEPQNRRVEIIYSVEE